MLTAEEDMEITALKKQGWSISAIARHVGRDRKTVRAYLNNEREPESLGSVEAPDLGNEDGAMPTDGRSGKPTTRRYSDAEKAQAVRLVCQLRGELGTEHGTVKRVAEQLGYGVESVRGWVRQADIDDGVVAGEAERITALEQENRELRRANAILRSASAFFAAELDRPPR
jgi:transposase-like protein